MAIHANRSLQKKDNTSFSRKKQAKQQAFQLTDRRKESSQQQHFQQMADNSSQSMNLDSLQNMTKGKNGDFFHAIAGASVPGSLDDVTVAGGHPLGTASLDLGSTEPPQNAVAPDFQINTIPINGHPNHFRAQIIKNQDADEGDVRAMHVKSGTYYTNYRWIPDSDLIDNGLNLNSPANDRVTTLNAMLSAIDYDHVYMNVSSANSNLSRDAEQEHLSDTRHAYNISIGALDQAIDTVIAQMPHNGYKPRTGAGYLSAQSARNDIFNRINRLLPAGSRGRISPNQNSWLNDYLNLTQMTQNRDGQNWHTFNVERSGFWYNNKLLKSVTELWDIYAEHPETTVQYVDAVPGPQININNVPSATVVHF